MFLQKNHFLKSDRKTGTVAEARLAGRCNHSLEECVSTLQHLSWQGLPCFIVASPLKLLQRCRKNSNGWTGKELLSSTLECVSTLQQLSWQRFTHRKLNRVGWGLPFVCELVSHHCIDIITVKGWSEIVAKFKATADSGMRLKQVSNCSLVRIFQPGKSTSCSLYPVLEEEGFQESSLVSLLVIW